MKRHLVFAFVAGTCGANAADLTLSADGLALGAIGDSTSHLERVLRQKIPVETQPGSCVVVAGFDQEKLGITYVIEDETLTRINVDYYGKSPSTIHTAAGIGLGSAEEDVMKAYEGRVRIESDTGDPSWHFLYVDEPDGSRGLRFDTDGKKVKSMHAGQYPALKLGCR